MTKFQEKVLNALGRTNPYVLDYDNDIQFNEFYKLSCQGNMLCRIIRPDHSKYAIFIELSEDCGTLGAALYAQSEDEEFEEFGEFVDWQEIQ